MSWIKKMFKRKEQAVNPLTVEEVESHLKWLTKTTSPETKFVFVAICKNRGMITYAADTVFCTNKDCFWCISFREKNKRKITT